MLDDRGRRSPGVGEYAGVGKRHRRQGVNREMDADDEILVIDVLGTQPGAQPRARDTAEQPVTERGEDFVTAVGWSRRMVSVSIWARSPMLMPSPPSASAPLRTDQ
jgi:hypothetical protein